MSTGGGQLITWDESGSAWVVRGHDAAVVALRDPDLVLGRTGDSRPLPADRMPGVAEFFASWFTVTDAHAEVKRVLAGAFSARRAAVFADDIGRIARAGVDALGDDGDLVPDYFAPFALRATLVVIGASDDEAARIGPVTRLLTAAFHGSSAAQATAANLTRCIGYLRAVTDRVIADAATPAGVALGELADRFGPWTATAALAQLMTAGVEPTTTGAALTYRARLREPDAPVHRLIDDALRANPPFPRVHRVARADVDRLGVAVKTGERVVVDIAEANRDTEAGASLSFGMGAHHCLGAALAREQIAAAVDALDGQGLDVSADGRAVHQGGHTNGAPALPFRRRAGVVGG